MRQRIGGVLDGQRITFYTGRNSSTPIAWTYDPESGDVRKLMERVVLASSFGELAIGVIDRQWRLRDVASGNEVVLPVKVRLDGVVALDSTVCAWTSQPTGFSGAVFPLASVPTSIPAC